MGKGGPGVPIPAWCTSIACAYWVRQGGAPAVAAAAAAASAASVAARAVSTTLAMPSAVGGGRPRSASPGEGGGYGHTGGWTCPTRCPLPRLGAGTGWAGGVSVVGGRSYCAVTTFHTTSWAGCPRVAAAAVPAAGVKGGAKGPCVGAGTMVAGGAVATGGVARVCGSRDGGRVWEGGGSTGSGARDAGGMGGPR